MHAELNFCVSYWQSKIPRTKKISVSKTDKKDLYFSFFTESFHLNKMFSGKIFNHLFYIYKFQSYQGSIFFILFDKVVFKILKFYGVQSLAIEKMKGFICALLICLRRRT